MTARASRAGLVAVAWLVAACAAPAGNMADVPPDAVPCALVLDSVP